MATPAYLQDLINYFNGGRAPFGRYQGYPEGGYEGGVDLGSPGGTPVYALETGPLMGAGYFCHGGGGFFNQTPACSVGTPGYGVVTQRINVPGYGPEDIYYQHIDIDPSLKLCQSGNCYGQIVQKGQRIGTIRGNVGMLEIGFNAGGRSSGPGGNGVTWGTIWGPAHPDQWYTDPRPLLKALIDNYGNPPSYTNDLTSGVSSLPLGLGNAITALQSSFANFIEETAIFLIALTVIILGVILLASKQIEEGARAGVKAGEIGLLA